MSASESGDRLLVAPVGPVRLAFDIASVFGVDEPDIVPTTDAFDALGLRPAVELAERRRLRFRGRVPFDLRVADGIRVVTVSPDALSPLPLFLAGMVQRIGLVGVVELEGELALVLNPTALEPA